MTNPLTPLQRLSLRLFPHYCFLPNHKDKTVRFDETVTATCFHGYITHIDSVLQAMEAIEDMPDENLLLWAESRALTYFESIRASMERNDWKKPGYEPKSKLASLDLEIDL